MKRIKQAALSLLLLLCLLLSACGTAAPAPSFDLEDIPEFSGEPYVVLEDNRPNFPEEEWAAEPFEEYSPLDSLGRCGRPMPVWVWRPCPPRSGAPSDR